jgi:hypothetical protein
MLFALLVAAASAWVPARWSSTDPRSLELLANTPVNCLLLERVSRDFVAAASDRQIAVLRVVRPGEDPGAVVKEATEAGVAGLVLEGAFADEVAQQFRDAARQANWTVVELPPRARLRLNTDAPIVGTYEGLWPGIRALEGDAARAAPTGGPWVETNTGFLRYVRAVTDAAVWIANKPPSGSALPVQRYLNAIADAALAGARWVVALDPDFDRRLHGRDAKALDAWTRIAAHLKFYEDHAEWRRWRPAGRLALIQDESSGALLSGGILDMIAVKHAPVRPLPRTRLTAAALKDARLVVNVDPSSLGEAEKEALRSFTRSGGTLLSGPPGWKFPPPQEGRITLEEKDLERLNEIWREVNSLRRSSQPRRTPVQRRRNALQPAGQSRWQADPVAPGQLHGLSGGEHHRTRRRRLPRRTPARARRTAPHALTLPHRRGRRRGDRANRDQRRPPARL